jgi:hypothetical protein
MMHVKVLYNRQRPIEVDSIFDTGAAITILPENLAEAAGFAHTGEAVLVDFDGTKAYTAPVGRCAASLDGSAWVDVPCALGRSAIMSPYSFTPWKFELTPPGTLYVYRRVNAEGPR